MSSSLVGLFIGAKILNSKISMWISTTASRVQWKHSNSVVRSSDAIYRPNAVSKRSFQLVSVHKRQIKWCLKCVLNILSSSKT